MIPYLFPFSIALGVFAAVLLATPWLIRYLEKAKLLVDDRHKEGRPRVVQSGGLVVVAGAIGGIFVFIFVRTFFPHTGNAINITNETLIPLFAGLLSLIIITLVGFLDDILINKEGTETTGLKQWQKPLLTLAAAVPLVVINAGVSTMTLPFFGTVDVGILYPLIFIPIGVVGAANMVNLIGGLNGIEAGMGAVAIGMLGIFAFIQGSRVASLIALMSVAALIGFYYYNRVPAKILPGDSLTYFIGGVIAVIAIIGNLERAAIIVAIPYLIEFVLKARGKFQKTTVGYYKDGKVCSNYDKIYSLPHIFMRSGKYTEKQIVISFIIFELIISSLIWIL